MIGTNISGKLDHLKVIIRFQTSMASNAKSFKALSGDDPPCEEWSLQNAKTRLALFNADFRNDEEGYAVYRVTR